MSQSSPRSSDCESVSGNELYDYLKPSASSQHAKKPAAKRSLKDVGKPPSKKYKVLQQLEKMSNYSSVTTDDEYVSENDVDLKIAKKEVEKKTAKRVSTKAPVIKKNKVNVSYQDRIKEMVKKEKIVVDAQNSVSVKQDDSIITVKTPVDENGSDYWTLAHYKCKNISEVDPKLRWKHSEGTVKFTVTDQSKDRSLSNDLDGIIQKVLTRMMADPKRKIYRAKSMASTE